jgi:hypothetical protein
MHGLSSTPKPLNVLVQYSYVSAGAYGSPSVAIGCDERTNPPSLALTISLEGKAMKAILESGQQPAMSLCPIISTIGGILRASSQQGCNLQRFTKREFSVSVPYHLCIKGDSTCVTL